jgi:hypothetical protein
MFFKYINKSKYIFITNSQLGRQCTQYWSLLHQLRLYILRALRQPRWGGGKEGYAISRPGLIWPELLCSMWTEAVRWCVKKWPWLLGLRRAPTKKNILMMWLCLAYPLALAALEYTVYRIQSAGKPAGILHFRTSKFTSELALNYAEFRVQNSEFLCFSSEVHE